MGRFFSSVDETPEFLAAVTIFDGFGPFIIAWLIRETGQKAAPSFYLMFAACVSFVALVAARRMLGFK